jgi:hypothetical protein
MNIKAPIRFMFLAGVGFILFFSLIALINNITSVIAEKTAIEQKKELEKNQKTDFLASIKKRYKEEFTRSVENETREVVQNAELIKIQETR